VQVVDEGELAAWVAQRDQVLEERDLALRPRQQHAALPRDVVVLLDHEGVVGQVGRRQLLDRHREGQVGRPRADRE
jgi:hypothetical protein